MNKWTIVFLGVCFIICSGREPFKPTSGPINFLVYFTSRYRGICQGMLVHRMVVITAAVCVINPLNRTHDTRPITVVTGTGYRHPRRGIRVQITKIITPKFKGSIPKRAYLIQKSVVLMLLKRNVPDILAEIPLRALEVDWKAEEKLRLQDECFIPGWHFFYRGDKIYPVHKFLLQRHLRVQFMNIVKINEWCEALELRMQKILHKIGYDDNWMSNPNDDLLCAKDGMYGAPFVCNGRAVGMLIAPDAQWTNCTGFTNIIHLFSASYLSGFFKCIKELITSEERTDTHNLKEAMYDDFSGEKYDILHSLYSRLDSSGSSSDEL